MNSDQLAGKWKQMKGSVKQQWGKLTDDDIEFINGKQESLVGKIQERYGIAKEEAQKRADEFMKTYGSESAQPKPATGTNPNLQHDQPHQAGKR
jgi:uncharacterized protein YjbJ (UPF0337 family)